MPTDYDKIREENIREYGVGTRHLAFLGQLYTDRTHFIFELLQNAEDAGATRILFCLFEDRLEIYHDGRPFNEHDVRGVCGVAVGTKKEDLKQIGKFGIGFKSVYAYTASPEIHSGEEGFKIEHYVRPYSVTSKLAGDSWSTLFVLPFNLEESVRSVASNEIGARLCKLTARTLLFLRNLNEIEYRLPDGKTGFYRRKENKRGTAREVCVTDQVNGNDEAEKWLIFERKVSVPGDSNTVSVEVSFRLKDVETAGKSTDQIVKVKNSPLVVYFPTEKATRFGFLIQGPYRTTPSRDNILKNDSWNQTLVKETADLIKQSLYGVKKLGLLSVSFLEALPIDSEDFPEESMFHPIFESVRESLMIEPLLPTDDGAFTTADKAKLARGAELRKLLNQEQLSQLFDSDATIKWLIGEINQTRSPELRSYLINEIHVEEVNAEGFAQRLNHFFLSEQPGEWFVAFYTYLSAQEALWRAPRSERDSGGTLRTKPILRLADGSQTVPFKSDGLIPNAYLPPSDETEYPVVSRPIVADEQARRFLKRLGLSEPDVFDDIVLRVLPKYDKVSNGVSISEFEHQADIQKIVRAMNSDSEAGKRKVTATALRTPFLKAINPAGETQYKCPSEMYLNTEELQVYFNGYSEVWFLHDAYTSHELDMELWSALGIATLPRKLPISDGLPPEEREHSTKKPTIENYDLEGLAHFLEALHQVVDFEEQKSIAFVLWRILKDYLELDEDFFKATYKWFYYYDLRKSFSSRILVRLQSANWIPIKDGSLENPQQINTYQLVSEFLGARELCEALGIVDGADLSEDERRREYAIELGVSLEDIEFIKNHRQEVEQLKDTLAAKKERPTFPTRQDTNRKRRQDRLQQERKDRPKKNYEKRERSVRTSKNSIDPTTWLRNHYTNDDDQMICQICKDEMPFRKRDGTYYFEKKELLTRKYLQEEHEAQYLALCPLCAAKYDEFVKTDDKATSELRQSILTEDDYEISISLGEEQASIRFVEKHLNDLKNIMGVILE